MLMTGFVQDDPKICALIVRYQLPIVYHPFTVKGKCIVDERLCCGSAEKRWTKDGGKAFQVFKRMLQSDPNDWRLCLSAVRE